MTDIIYSFSLALEYVWDNGRVTPPSQPPYHKSYACDTHQNQDIRMFSYSCVVLLKLYCHSTQAYFLISSFLPLD